MERDIETDNKEYDLIIKELCKKCFDYIVILNDKEKCSENIFEKRILRTDIVEGELLLSIEENFVHRMISFDENFKNMIYFSDIDGKEVECLEYEENSGDALIRISEVVKIFDKYMNVPEDEVYGYL